MGNVNLPGRSLHSYASVYLLLTPFAAASTPFTLLCSLVLLFVFAGLLAACWCSPVRPRERHGGSWLFVVLFVHNRTSSLPFCCLAACPCLSAVPTHRLLQQRLFLQIRLLPELRHLCAPLPHLLPQRRSRTPFPSCKRFLCTGRRNKPAKYVTSVPPLICFPNSLLFLPCRLNRSLSCRNNAPCA